MHLYHYSGFFMKRRTGIAGQVWVDGDLRSEEKISHINDVKDEIIRAQPDLRDDPFTLVSLTYLHEIERE